MEFSRQEYWGGLPFPSPGHLSDPGIEPTSPESPVLTGGFIIRIAPGKPFHGKGPAGYEICSLLLRGLNAIYSKTPCLKGTPPVCYSQLLVWERDVFLICTSTNVAISQAMLIPDMPHCLLSVKRRSLWRKVACRKYGCSVYSVLVVGPPYLRSLESYANYTKGGRSQRLPPFQSNSPLPKLASL